MHRVADDDRSGLKQTVVARPKGANLIQGSDIPGIDLGGRRAVMS